MVSKYCFHNSEKLTEFIKCRDRKDRDTIILPQTALFVVESQN